MTLAEYLRTPETVKPQELIFGAVRVADSPAPVHQAAVAALFLALHDHVSARRLGTVWLAPLDVVLDVERALVVQPDLFFIREDGTAVVSDKVFGAPDLVIEVLSPRPRIGECEERLEWFAAYGVRECWLVHHLIRKIEVVTFGQRQATTRRVHAEGESIESTVLPEFDRTLASILGYR
jgi:Uma2 family endonuclease